MSRKSRLRKMRHERQLRDLEFELFQRRVDEGIAALHRQICRNGQPTRLISRGLPGAGPILSAPALQPDESGVANV